MSAFKISALVAATLIGAQAANVCGSNGYDTSGNDYYYDDSGKQGNYATCSQVCVKDSKCKSFAFSSDTCILYPNAVTGNFDADSSSPYKFYDRACVSTTTTTTSTSSKTSTSSSSSTSAKSSTKTSSTTLSTSTTSATKSSSSSSSSTSSTSSRSTSSAKVSSTTSSAPTSSTSAVVVPSGCSIPNSYTVTGFSWFNSTHNLDCITGPDVGDGTGCLDSTTGNWCDPNLDPACTHCGVAVCSTGLPPQPVGYGPPDDIKITLSDGTVCEQLNPMGYRRYPVGNGQVGCGSAYPFMFFYGNSNPAKSNGTVQINGYGVTCNDGQTITGHYETAFPVSCTHDAQFNATCSTPGNVVVPLTSFTKSQLN